VGKMSFCIVKPVVHPVCFKIFKRNKIILGFAALNYLIDRKTASSSNTFFFLGNILIVPSIFIQFYCYDNLTV